MATSRPLNGGTRPPKKRPRVVVADSDAIAMVRAGKVLTESKVLTAVASSSQALLGLGNLLSGEGSVSSAAVGTIRNVLNLGSTSDMAFQALVDGGAVEKLVELLGSQTTTLQAHASHLLGMLAYHSAPTSNRIVNGGAVKRLIGLLESSSQHVQKASACALGQIAHRGSGKAALVRAGAVRAMVGRLQSTHPSVQKWAAYALGQLAHNSMERSAAIAQVRGWGECGQLPGPHILKRSALSALLAQEESAVQRLVGLLASTANGVQEWAAEVWHAGAVRVASAPWSKQTVSPDCGHQARCRSIHVVAGSRPFSLPQPATS